MVWSSHESMHISDNETENIVLAISKSWIRQCVTDGRLDNYFGSNHELRIKLNWQHQSEKYVAFAHIKQGKHRGVTYKTLKMKRGLPKFSNKLEYKLMSVNFLYKNIKESNNALISSFVKSSPEDLKREIYTHETTTLSWKIYIQERKKRSWENPRKIKEN